MIIPSSSFLIFFLYSLLSTFSSAEIKIGSTLLPTTLNPWKSPNNSFSLSFIPIDSSFSLAISFSNIPIWKAGGDLAIVDSNSRFEFLPNGNLCLINGSDVIIWQSNTSNLGVTVANLDDSGNLALKNGSTTVWSSFDNPTDTILPTQNFTTSKTLKSGFYSFNLLSSGNVTLKWNENTTYWNLGLNSTINSNLISPYLTLSPTGVLQLNDFNLSNPVNLAFSSDYGEGNDIFRFLKLDSDGNLRIYSFGNGNLIERWAAVQDQCLVYGWCGNMGICSYNESKPICICPSRNFDYFDQNNSRKGCKRKVEIENCPTEKVMLELDNTKFLTYQPELTSQSITGTASGILACKTNCLPDDTCTASTSLADGTGLCYMKRSKIISGYHSPALRSTSYIKVCGPIILNPPLFDPNMVPSGKRFTLHRWVIVYVVLITLLCLVFMGGVIWLWYYRNDRNYVGLSRQYALVEYASVAPIQFTYKELERSTKGFTEKIGSGGFGSVYRGVLPNRTVVAVKQLEGIEQGEKQFRMEVSIISSTHHLNLMRLVGFCSLGRHRLVVYEFMKNGSLDNFIFTAEESSRKLLNWETRFRVALGTAKGITYLHEECRECIIHCDIKPENILLDENYNARVSDFGLSKLINPKHLHHWHKTLTSLRGTRGYLAPEWVANLAITPKSDVYSYGMVLLEMVMGRRNFEVSEETSWKKSSVWAYEEFESGNLHNIVDKRLAKQETDMEQVLRAIQTSFWCIQEQPIHRPKMGKVVQMLEGITPIERPPVPNGSTEGFVNRNGGTNVSENANFVTTIASSDLSLSSSSVQASRGLLWMGWAGFNSGAPCTSNLDASMAIFDTNICAATSLLVWTCLDVIFFHKPSVIGVVQGMITGLVCITPGAGLVQGWAAIIMGVLSGSIPWFTMMVIHKKSTLLQKVDDTLGVFHTHAVAGILGGILTGLFAEPELCAFFLPVTNSRGAIYGGSGGMQLVKQIVSAGFIVVLNVIVTSIICLLIKLVMPLRMSEEHLIVGDDAAHGEEAYALWGDGETYDESRHGWYSDETLHKKQGDNVVGIQLASV